MEDKSYRIQLSPEVHTLLKIYASETERTILDVILSGLIKTHGKELLATAERRLAEGRGNENEVQAIKELIKEY